MAREKLKQFLRDVVGSEATGISYVVKDPGEDGLDPGVDDLGRTPISAGGSTPLIGHNSENKPDAPEGGSLINDFTNYLTDLQNYFPVKGGAEESPPLSRTDENGVDNELEEAGANEKNVYINPSESDVAGLGVTLPQYSESNYETGNGKIVKKAGKPSLDRDELVAEGGFNVSGHVLLKNIEGRPLSPMGGTFKSDKDNDKDQQSIKAVQSMLGTRNRFNPTDSIGFAPFDTPGGLKDKIDVGTDSVGTRTVQTGYGKYSDPSSTNADIAINEDMAKVASSMILSALGLNDAASADPDDFEAESEIGAIVQKDVVAGTSVQSRSPRAEKAFGSPLRDAGRAQRGAFEVDGKQKSFGQTYSYDMQFSKSDGSLSVTRARAAAVIIAMLYLCKELASSLSNFDLPNNVPFDTRSPKVTGQMRSYAANSYIQIFRRYAIPVTRYPLKECVDMGAKAMFSIGVSKGAQDGSGFADIAGYQVLSEAAGFWHAIGSSMLKKAEGRKGTLSTAVQKYKSDLTSENLKNIFDEVADIEGMRILRVLAQIGDNILYSTGGNKKLKDAVSDGVKPFNVDLLKDGPQTRQSKSRSKTGQTEASLAWRGESAPGMYLLPRNVIKATIELNTFNAGGNPVKGHTTNSLLPKSFIDPNPGFSDKTRGRIPTNVARMIEDTLDSEYVPFYFHDIRTNEFIGFHAFLNDLSDSYSANYTTSQGYGRVDPVYIYKDTKRSIQFSFYVAATSKEDFDEMWFKINKLTTLVYPQWSKGTPMVDDEGNKFIQPFSQVIGATPLTRLRIGDVIKSNYSKFNLARMFGVGDDEFLVADDTFKPIGGASGLLNISNNNAVLQKIADLQLNLFAGVFGSPLAISPLSGDAGAKVADVIATSVAMLAVQALGGTPLLNPLGAMLVMGELKNPDSVPGSSIPSSNFALEAIEDAANTMSGFNINNAGNPTDSDSNGYTKTSFPYLKPSMDAGYRIKGTNNRLRTVSPYRVKVKKKERTTKSFYKDANKAGVHKQTTDGGAVNKLYYEVEFFDFDAPALGDNKTLLVFHEDLMPNPDYLFLLRVGTVLNVVNAAAAAAQSAMNETAGKLTGIPANALQLTTTDANEFMHPVNNPITRAFENSGGRGLAGVIRSLSYAWIDNTVTWETEWGSRAPKIAKVNVSFEPIHDLPPGIDHGGYNRAPNYNVGATMNSISGDAHPDEGFGSKAKYTRAATKAAQTIEDIE